MAVISTNSERSPWSWSRQTRMSAGEPSPWLADCQLLLSSVDLYTPWLKMLV